MAQNCDSKPDPDPSTTFIKLSKIAHYLFICSFDYQSLFSLFVWFFIIVGMLDAGIRYGKYCGVGWTGCPGEKPCDDVDACCKIHDECVGKHGTFLHI